VTHPLSGEALSAIFFASPERGGEPLQRWWGFVPNNHNLRKTKYAGGLKTKVAPVI